LDRIDEPLVASTGFAVLTPRGDINPRCIGYIVQSEYFTNQVTAHSTGVAYPGISETKLANLPITLPPLTEQVAIVRFLDWANDRLARAIDAKRKVLVLLNEQKQWIVHRAVTRGLEPSIPLKPSGIPWLGDIPKHWEVLRSKYIYREVDDRSPTGAETHLSMSQKLGLVPNSQMQEKRLVSESYAGGKLCEKRDLVLNRLKAHLGVFAVAPEPACQSDSYRLTSHS
jgi:type I restriction enzyme S subunit